MPNDDEETMYLKRRWEYFWS